MARGHAWYGVLHLAFFLGVFMEESTMGSFDIARAVGTVGTAMGEVLLTARCLGIVALGVTFDRLGPRLCFATSSVAYLGYMLAVRLLGLDARTVQVARVLAHPSFGFAALGLQDCAYEERPGFIAHLQMTYVLAFTVHVVFSTQMAARGGVLAYFALMGLHMALWWRLSRQEGTVCIAGDSAEPAGVAGGKQLFGVLGTPPASPTQSLPAPTTASSTSAHEGLGRLFARPEVYTAFFVAQAVSVLEEARRQATKYAAIDEKETAIDGWMMMRVSLSSFAILLLVWAYLPGAFVHKFGPSAVVQSTLEVMALTDLVAFLCLALPLPPDLLPFRSMQLQFCFVAASLAGIFLHVVCGVFVVGIVGPGERGTLLSLTQLGDGGRGLPIFIWNMLLQAIYRAGGCAAVIGVCSAGSVGLLLLFRISPLPQFRLKKT
mmetsp:Transcript_2240/g.7535  ORF Transcript_2240/g.7535 Transcript_2240/m.7535 type:complete len:433 (+) Transcript_2240:63-1361(+)